MEVGSRVIIQNLISKPELNGTTAVVLQESEAEAGQLRSQGRIKVTGGSSFKPLSLKAENLLPIDESKAKPIDWSLLDGPNSATSDVASMIRIYKQLGEIDRCDEFVRLLSRAVNQQGAPINILQLKLHDANFFSMLVNNVTNHFIYFFHLDQISHHLVVEVHQGRGRLFHSFIQEAGRGWKGNEWIQPQPPSGWPEEVIQVHTKYGGGKEFNHKYWVELLDTIKTIQACTKAITDRYEEFLPADLVKAQAQWDKELYKRQQSPDSIEPLGDWCNYFFEHPWMASIYRHPDDGSVTVFSNEMYDRLESDGYPSFVLKFPKELVDPLENAVKKLHGVELCAVNYIMLFRFRGWETKYGMDPATGKFLPLGWTVGAFSIPH